MAVCTLGSVGDISFSNFYGTRLAAPTYTIEYTVVAGGGGGGASANGFTSGAGGAGGNGFCRVTTYS
jgi:hypothetical protein